MTNLKTRKCPKCKEEYNDYPALSRKDNKTEICPNCGATEALEDYFGKRKNPKEETLALLKEYTEFVEEDGDVEAALILIKKPINEAIGKVAFGMIGDFENLVDMLVVACKEKPHMIPLIMAALSEQLMPSSDVSTLKELLEKFNK